MPLINVESLVAKADGSPRVNIYWQEGSRPVNISPEEARDLALNLLQAAEAAETDSCLLQWGMSDLKLERRAAAALISALRDYRERRKQQHESREH